MSESIDTTKIDIVQLQKMAFLLGFSALESNFQTNANVLSIG